VETEEEAKSSTSSKWGNGLAAVSASPIATS
jgi:hypothetical protein